MKRTTTIDKNATAPTGHLPFAVQAALRTSEGGALLADADTARQHEPSPVLLRESELNPGELAMWGHEGGQVIAAFDPTQISRSDAETRLRAQMNAQGIRISEFRPEHEPLLTAAQTTLVPDDSLGAHRTALIESTTREIVDSGPAEYPWFAAEIVVSDYRSQAYGRRTQLWLHNNRDTAELTPTEARATLREARAFLDRFEALIDRAETLAAGDFEGDPEIAAADREGEARRIRAIDDARLARATALLTEAHA